MVLGPQPPQYKLAEEAKHPQLALRLRIRVVASGRYKVSSVFQQRPARLLEHPWMSEHKDAIWGTRTSQFCGSPREML